MQLTPKPTEPTVAIDIRAINKDVDGSTTRSYFATVDGQPVATVDVNDWQKAGGWISWVYVDENFRRKGIARKLFNRVMLDAIKAGKSGLGLSVKPENEAAQALYESLGFRVCYTYEAGLLLMTLHL